MQFRTELKPDRLPVSLQLHSRIITVGSCFAEVMGGQLAGYKLDVLNNPFGTLFNPVSIVKNLLTALNGDGPDQDLYVEREGLWFHYDFHSSLWAESREALEQRLIQRLSETGEALRKSDWLFLTLGTAVVYRHLATGKVVANCHKMPGTLFENYLYHIDAIRDSLTELIQKLKRVNPALQLLLTVSPIRHIKDTLPLNSASKAMLRVAAHEMTVWHPQVHYFPAYEIVVDDLRDYRFYEADLIHLTTQAEEYIFGKFAESCFDDELRSFMAEWQGIRKALAHRPFYEASESHRRFLEDLLSRLDRISRLVNVDAEREEVLNRLSDGRSRPGPSLLRRGA